MVEFLKDLDPDENLLDLVIDGNSSYLTEDQLYKFFDFDDKYSFNVLHSLSTVAA